MAIDFIGPLPFPKLLLSTIKQMYNVILLKTLSRPKFGDGLKMKNN